MEWKFHALNFITMDKITKGKLINRQEINTNDGKGILCQIMSINFAVSNLFSRFQDKGTHGKMMYLEKLSSRKYVFSLFLFVNILFFNSSFSQSIIQIRQKAVREEISPDFTYHTLGAATSNFKITAL